MQAETSLPGHCLLMCTISHTVCIAGDDWTSLNGFAQATGLDLLFDLNVLLRNGTQWDSSNARLLLEYSNRHRFNISWQLGNGMYPSLW
jgi:nicotinamide riboside kinase